MHFGCGELQRVPCIPLCRSRCSLPFVVFITPCKIEVTGGNRVSAAAPDRQLVLLRATKPTAVLDGVWADRTDALCCRWGPGAGSQRSSPRFRGMRCHRHAGIWCETRCSWFLGQNEQQENMIYRSLLSSECMSEQQGSFRAGILLMPRAVLNMVPLPAAR